VVDIATDGNTRPHRCITFRVGLSSPDLDDFMHEVMEHIPEAEFGPVVSASPEKDDGSQ